MLYGKVLKPFIGLSKKKEVVVDTKFECTRCKLVLNVKIKAKKDGIPSYWFNAQYNRCGEFNLLASGESTTEFTSVENFYGDNNTAQHVKARLEQIRYISNDVVENGIEKMFV